MVDLNPYLLKFMTTLLIEIKPKFLLEYASTLPNIYSLHVHMFVYFFNEKPLRIKLTESCLRIVFLCFEKIKEFAENGVIPNIVNNTLLTKIVKNIDFQKTDDKKFTESQKLLLEIYLSLNDLCKAVKDKTNVKFDSILETTIGIS